MRRLTWIVCLFSLVVFLDGCGGTGSGGSSVSSSWLGTGIDREAGSPAQISIMAARTQIPVGESSGIAIAVLDKFGRPLNAIDVGVSASLGGTFDVTSGPTVNGWFHTNYTAGTSVGTETITVLAGAVVASSTIAITVRTLDPPVIKLFLGGTTLVSGKASDIGVYVTRSGVAAENVTVNLTSSLGGLFEPSSGATANGWFTTKFTPDITPGETVITASTGDVATRTKAIVTIPTIDPPKVSLFLGTTTLTQGKSTGVAAYVTRAGVAAENVTIYLSSSLGGTLDPISGTTLGGWFTSKFTPETTLGQTTITASTGDVATSAPITIVAQSTDVPRIDLFPGATTLNPGKTVGMAAYVTRGGVAADNVTVYLSSSLGGTFDPNTGATTNGWFTSKFTPDTTLGKTTIVVSTGEVATNTAITIVQAPQIIPKISVQCDPATIFVGDTTLVLVQMTDPDGQPSTAKVFLSSSLGGTFDPAEGTVSSGLLSSKFTAGKGTGKAIISALSFGVTATSSLTIAPLIKTVKVILGKTVMLTSSTDNPVAVYFTDSLGRPIANATVLLSSSEGTFSTSSGDTNANGFYSTYFQAGATAGPCTVIAQVEDAVGQATGTIQ